MRIWLNDFELNNPAKRVYINEDIDGLDTPGIRTSNGVRSGQSGGYIGAQFYEARYVTIRGSIFSNDVAEALQKRREIQSALPLFPTVITVRVEDDDGRSYVFDAQVMDFKMPIKRGRMRSLFKLELEAPDSVIYDNSAGTSLEATINQVVPGGLHWTDITPQFDTTFYFMAGQPSSTVDNTSELESYPVIVISGATTDPVITNRTTGESFRLEGYAVGSDQATEIDMKNRTVKLGLITDLVNGVFPEGVGGNVFAYAPADVDWWPLVPGNNEIEFTSGSGGDVTTAKMFWRPGYRGI